MLRSTDHYRKVSKNLRLFNPMSWHGRPKKQIFQNIYPSDLPAFSKFQHKTIGRKGA